DSVRSLSLSFHSNQMGDHDDICRDGGVAVYVLHYSLLCRPSGQVVRATWYGNELRGHRTASGEVFNPGGMTAAHKSLALGTCLLVSNPSTGKKVAVRVNDRGPFTPGVTLDPSSGAARAIGMRSTQSVTMSRC